MDKYLIICNIFVLKIYEYGKNLLVAIDLYMENIRIVLNYIDRILINKTIKSKELFYFKANSRFNAHIHH